MKLRNKKTGKWGDYFVTTDGDRLKVRNYFIDEEIYQYDSLDGFNEEWKDYTPAEPVIKDEKIRKAVRAWAEVDGADEKIYLTIHENGSTFENKYGGYIEFAFQIDMEEGLYTISELCGEEEE